MVLRIDNNILNDNSELPVNTPARQEQKQDVIPVGKAEETKTEKETPVDGYYIEKTAQTPEDDDPLDTSVNPDARITMNPSL